MVPSKVKFAESIKRPPGVTEGTGPEVSEERAQVVEEALVVVPVVISARLKVDATEVEVAVR